MNLGILIEASRPHLTDNQQKVADFVLANPFPVATMGIEELARATETSSATINRFVRALGLQGYAEFRAFAVQGYQSLLLPVENLDRARQHTSIEVASNSFANARRLVDEIGQRAEAPVWEDVAQRLVTARRVAFLGFGVSANILDFLANLTEPFIAPPLMLTGEGGLERIARRIARLGPEDLIIASALPRYSQATVDFLKLARGRGVYSIVITDGPHSPLAKLSHEPIFVPAAHPVLHGSSMAAFAVVETIGAVLAARHQSTPDAVSLTRFIMPYLYAEDKDGPQANPRNVNVPDE